MIFSKIFYPHSHEFKMILSQKIYNFGSTNKILIYVKIVIVYCESDWQTTCKSKFLYNNSRISIMILFYKYLSLRLFKFMEIPTVYDKNKILQIHNNKSHKTSAPDNLKKKSIYKSNFIYDSQIKIRIKISNIHLNINFKT